MEFIWFFKCGRASRLGEKFNKSDEKLNSYSDGKHIWRTPSQPRNVRSSLPVALRVRSPLCAESFSSLRCEKCEHSARAVRWCFDALSRTIRRKRVETLPKKAKKPKESTVESLYPGKLIFLFLRNGWAESGEKKESAKLRWSSSKNFY